MAPARGMPLFRAWAERGLDWAAAQWLRRGHPPLRFRSDLIAAAGTVDLRWPELGPWISMKLKRVQQSKKTRGALVAIVLVALAFMVSLILS